MVYRSAVIQAEASPDGVENEPAGFHQTGQPGGRAPHAWIYRDGRRKSTFDLAGAWLTLLIGAQGDDWTAAAGQLAPSTSSPLVALQCGHDFDDRDGLFHYLHGISPWGAVLVRPDGHVAWRSHASRPDPVESLRWAVDDCVGAGMPIDHSAVQ